MNSRPQPGSKVMKQFTTSASVALIVLALACLIPPVSAQVQSGTESAAAAAGAHPLSQTPPTSVNNSQYLIGESDMLAINVWREQEISRVVPVRPDGKISLPLIGDVQATGLTAEALQANIARELKRFIDSPEVTVIVQEARSQKFNVVGEVMRPGTFVLSQPMTVLDALALAGGFKDFAKVKSIYVLRTSQRLPFNYKEVIKGKNSSQNIQLQSGDTVVVP